jgi:hypothetical protein
LSDREVKVWCVDHFGPRKFTDWCKSVGFQWF